MVNVRGQTDNWTQDRSCIPTYPLLLLLLGQVQTCPLFFQGMYFKRSMQIVRFSLIFGRLGETDTKTVAEHAVRPQVFTSPIKRWCAFAAQ